MWRGTTDSNRHTHKMHKTCRPTKCSAWKTRDNARNQELQTKENSQVRCANQTLELRLEIFSGLRVKYLDNTHIYKYQLIYIAKILQSYLAFYLADACMSTMTGLLMSLLWDPAHNWNGLPLCFHVCPLLGGGCS